MLRGESHDPNLITSNRRVCRARFGVKAKPRSVVENLIDRSVDGDRHHGLDRWNSERFVEVDPRDIPDVVGAQEVVVETGRVSGGPRE